jgi:hypothetical protein
LIDRWSRYAELHASAGFVRTAYNTWMSQVISLGYLLAFRPPPARVLSIGCSAAFFDVLLAAHGYHVTSIDNDERVLEGARRTAATFDANLDIQLGDAFDLAEHHDRYDVAYSAGLVEHWYGGRTVELIREHARCAPLVQVEVPTAHTRKVESIPDVVEDMYLHTPREFRSRVRAAGLEPLKLYPLGSVPGRTREVIESLVPAMLFRRLQLLTGHSMGIGCIARRHSP